MKRLGLLLLVLGLPPLVIQLRTPVPRLDADAVEYYSHLRSLYFDHDLDFADEFAHFGILTRYDKIQPTATGHRRTIFSVGPALLWLPFYAVGDLVARAAGRVEDGYSVFHIRAVMLGSLFYALLGLLLLDRVLSALVPAAEAFWTLVLLLYATFLYWYAVVEPVMSHAGSFFAASLVLWLFWEGRRGLGTGRAVLLGLAIGLAADVRWQNGVLLLLPAAALLPELRSRPRAAVSKGLATLAAFGIGALPQLLAWKAIFGTYLLLTPPHGADFLRLTHPFLLETFFSSRHGLLYWTPVLWGGFLGLVPLLRRELRGEGGTGPALVLVLLVMSYVNVCSGDWWAGGSFSNRRFDSVLPILALGLAAALVRLKQVAARHPGWLLTAAGGLLVLWNLLFMEQFRRNLIPRDDTVSFPRVAANNAGVLAEWAGSPLAWPANWIFALRHDLPAERYDLLSGKYLFYRQNNLGGVIDIAEDPRLDAALLAGGWSVRHPCGGARCRDVEGRARVFAPLDVPETLDLAVRAEGSGDLFLAVNGKPLAEWPLAPDLAELRVRIGGSYFHREANELVFTTGPGGWARVDRLVFERVPAPGSGS